MDRAILDVIQITLNIFIKVNLLVVSLLLHSRPMGMSNI